MSEKIKNLFKSKAILIYETRNNEETRASDSCFPSLSLLMSIQPPPFSMTSKLLIYHVEANSYCFTVSCVPEGMFNYLE